MIFILAEVFVTFLVAVCVLRSYFPELDHSLGIATAFSVVCGLLIEISVQLYRNESDGSWNLEETDYNQTEQPPLILWWTQPFAASLSAAVSRSCYIKTCAFTGDRELFRRSAARKAIAFYGSDTNISDLPLPRKDEEFWALLHEESPKNGPHFTSRHFLSLFNFTSTFSRHSHMPLTTLHLPSLNDITDYKYFVNTNEKNKWRDRTAPVLYVQSNCDTLTNRDAFVQELSQYVKIDSFGSCLRNGELPDKLVELILPFFDDHLDAIQQKGTN